MKYIDAILLYWNAFINFIYLPLSVEQSKSPYMLSTKGYTRKLHMIKIVKNATLIEVYLRATDIGFILDFEIEAK